MQTEIIVRKIIREMGDTIWTTDENGFVIVPDSPDEVDKVLEFIAPYFDDIDESDVCLYDGCDCDDDYDGCNGAQMPELPKHDPSIA